MREKLSSLIRVHLMTALMTACSAGGNCVLGVAFTAAVFEKRLAGWAGLLVSEAVMFLLADPVLFTKYSGMLAVMAAFTLISRTVKAGGLPQAAAARRSEDPQEHIPRTDRDAQGGPEDIRIRSLYAGIGMALLELTDRLFEGLTLPGTGLALWYGIACGILTTLFETGVTSLLAGESSFWKQRSETMIGTACFLAAAAYAVIGSGFLPEFVWQCLACLLLLYMGYAYGPAMGAVSGAAIGIVLSFFAGEVSYLGILCFLGLLCGMFRELGRFAETVAFFAGTAGLMFCGVPFLAELRWLAGVLAAGGLWILCDLILTVRERYSKSQSAAECAGTVSGNGKGPGAAADDPKTGREAEVLCAELSAAEDERLADILGEFAGEVLGQSGEEGGASCYGSFPTGETPDPEISGRFWEEKYQETRETLAVWMAETGKMLKSRRRAGTEFAKPGEKMRAALKKRLAEYGVQTHEVWQKQNPDGQTELRFLWSTQMGGDRRHGRPVMVKDVLPAVNDAFGMVFEPAHENRSLIGKDAAVYEFLRTPNFKILQGSATTKKSETDGNGDTFGVARIGTAQVLFGIADGVGSGRDAADAAAHSLEQLEQLLKSGISEETSLRLLDSLEILRDGQGAALDFGVINLNTGVCHLLKAGGAPGFILRGQWVELLDAKSLPLGLLPGAGYEQKVKKLYDGDVILLLSDGVFQAFPGANRAEEIGNYLTQIGELGPRDMAQCLLDKALSFGKAEDDMSVLAIGVYE